MANYVRNSLLPKEEILFETRYHWLIYLGGPFGIFLCLVTVGYFLIGLLLAFPFIFITRNSSEFAVTNKRIVIKSGFLSMRTIEMMLSKVESLDVSQGIFGRMFDYGSVTVRGTGGTREKFASSSNPCCFEEQFKLNNSKSQKINGLSMN